MLQAFLYRRLAKYITCVFNFPDKSRIAMRSKHHVASFQDVFCNAFYWESLHLLNSDYKKVIDLGSNMGYFCLLVENYLEYKQGEKPEYILVEANHKLLPQLEKNISDFKIPSSRYRIIHGIAGALVSQAFYINDKNMLASKVEANINGQMVSPVDLNSADFQSPSIVKIDIEGSEYDVFKNYYQWLITAQAIILEMHGSEKENEYWIAKLKLDGFKVLISHKDRFSGYLNITLTK